MKTNAINRSLFLIHTMLLICLSNSIIAQWGILLTNFGRTTSAITSVGVGAFPTTTEFQARMHVNNFYCFSPSGSLNGRLFRTDGDQSVLNTWQMFSGTSATSQSERFRIAVQPNGWDTYLTRTQGGSESEVRFLTAELQLWARAKRLAAFCEISTGADEITLGDGTDVNTTLRSAAGGRLFFRGNDAFTGLGHLFSESGQQPNYLLHLNDSIFQNNVLQQFTNRWTGYGINDGLRLGVLGDGIAEVRNFENTFLDFYQRNRLRQRYFNIATWNGLNGLTGANFGRTFLSLDGTTMDNNPAGAWSLLHLGQRNVSTANRNWMNIGITMTNRTTVAQQELGDYMYIGLMERPLANVLESVDAVVSWGCNDGSNAPSDGPDNLRFIFTTAATGVGTAATNQGRETMRITPNGNIGIGDWSGNIPANAFGQAGYIGATLDINGDLRVRSVAQDQALTRILVIDPNDQNRLHWRTSQGLDCNWITETYGIGTGYAPSCNTQNVGIGTLPDEKVKLKVQTTSIAQTEAIKGINLNTGGIGGWFQGAGWAVYSNGSSLAAGGSWVPSDAQLKTNIDEIHDALGILQHLKPKTYNYASAEFESYVNLPTTQQFGLIAQEVQEVLPSLVKDASIPSQIDQQSSEMVAPSPTLEIKVMNYDQLIPILVQAVKDQQVEIDQLRVQLNSCCVFGTIRSQSEQSSLPINAKEESIVLNQNTPNPFAEKTTIQVELPEGFGKAEVFFFDQTGRQIKSMMITDCSVCILNVFADDLSSGIYTYALVVDGNVIQTKKMIRN